MNEEKNEILEPQEGMNLNDMLEHFERHLIRQACEKHGSSRKAAKAIGISQTQLIRKKEKYRDLNDGI